MITDLAASPLVFRRRRRRSEHDTVLRPEYFAGRPRLVTGTAREDMRWARMTTIRRIGRRRRGGGVAGQCAKVARLPIGPFSPMADQPVTNTHRDSTRTGRIADKAVYGS